MMDLTSSLISKPESFARDLLAFLVGIEMLVHLSNFLFSDDQNQEPSFQIANFSSFESHTNGSKSPTSNPQNQTSTPQSTNPDCNQSIETCLLENAILPLRQQTLFTMILGCFYLTRAKVKRIQKEENDIMKKAVGLLSFSDEAFPHN